jgi:uncharacterized membrane protein YfcA
VLETATTLGALTGMFFVGLAPVPFLYGLFAVVLLVSARQMLARRSDPAGTSIAAAGLLFQYKDLKRRHLLELHFGRLAHIVLFR